MSELTVTIIMAALTLGIIGWDVWLWLDQRDGNTITERVRYWDQKIRLLKFLITFAFGLLTGHFFWT